MASPVGPTITSRKFSAHRNDRLRNIVGPARLEKVKGFLINLADKLMDNRDELGMMDCVDSGNALNGMKVDVNWSSDSLKYFANLITEIKGQTHSEKSGHLNFTRRHPYGVVAKINPFNHPLRFIRLRTRKKEMKVKMMLKSLLQI